MKTKKARYYTELSKLCREDKIRTCDPLNPIQVRYRAAPLPETGKLLRLAKLSKFPVLPIVFLSIARRLSASGTLSGSRWPETAR